MSAEQGASSLTRTALATVGVVTATAIAVAQPRSLKPMSTRKLFHFLTGPIFFICLCFFPRGLKARAVAAAIPAGSLVTIWAGKNLQCLRRLPFLGPMFSRLSYGRDVGVKTYGLVFAAVPLVAWEAFAPRPVDIPRFVAKMGAKLVQEHATSFRVRTVAGGVRTAIRGVRVDDVPCMLFAWSSLVLAFGDGAAVVGVTARHKWPQNPRKSLFGSAAFVVVASAGILLLWALCPWLSGASRTLIPATGISMIDQRLVVLALRVRPPCARAADAPTRLGELLPVPFLPSILAACLAEALPLGSYDNGFVVAAALLDHVAPRLLRTVLLGTHIACLAFFKRWVTKAGAIVGGITFGVHAAADAVLIAEGAAHGPLFSTLLLVFLVLGSLLTRRGRGDRSKRGRRAAQVVCNSFAATAIATLIAMRAVLNALRTRGRSYVPAPLRPMYILTDWLPCDASLAIVALAQYAGALGDTLSSEIGSLAIAVPRDVLAPWHTVPRGFNGGVTLLGLSAGASGGFLLGFLASWLAPTLLCTANLPKLVQHAAYSCAGGALALVNSLVDSVFGSLLQYTGRRPDGSVTNHRSIHAIQISRYSLLNNNQVNFLACIATCGAAIAIAVVLECSD
eukprot:gnl/Chilomastix_cuspidata/3225.p1 GENE.gnl/Chilomastix_cuspidata/3225~~gnl/Chilomastix_cuspidata/3225.p1  ORF type:complete len:694 (+),score=49.58 gnl/Chilomastix_cuspidata/3225:218-2083(+)